MWKTWGGQGHHGVYSPHPYVKNGYLGMLRELDIQRREGENASQREIVHFMARLRDDGHPICTGPDQWETWSLDKVSGIERGWIRRGTKNQRPFGYCG